jgi:predicted RNase H-like HicB family nuclease
MYIVGFPGWKIAARIGIPMLVRINVHYDPEAKSYWTTSPDLDGLIVTGCTLDELLHEAKLGMDGLMELALQGKTVQASPRLSFTQEALCAA